MFEELTDRSRDCVEGYRALCATPPPPRRRAAAAHAPLVSIVMPYFQLERYLSRRRSRSVAAQTYPATEIVVVNDGSLREEDAAFLERRGAPCGRRSLTQVNSGLGAARNFGIAQSRGRLRAAARRGRRDRAGVRRALRRRPRARRRAGVRRRPGCEYMDPERPAAVGRRRRATALRQLVPADRPQQRRRNLHRADPAARLRAGYRYSVDLTSYEDWFLYRELHHAGLFGAVIPERLFRYRVRDESMMRRSARSTSSGSSTRCARTTASGMSSGPRADSALWLTDAVSSEHPGQPTVASLDQLARAQRYAWAAEVCAGMTVLALDGRVEDTAALGAGARGLPSGSRQTRAARGRGRGGLARRRRSCQRSGADPRVARRARGRGTYGRRRRAERPRVRPAWLGRRRRLRRWRTRER